jgi:uncharacterized protein YjiS (DUF1127 family)
MQLTILTLEIQVRVRDRPSIDWSRLWALIQSWEKRSRQRRELGLLDDHLLRDIGVSREAAGQEAAKPFWKL